MCLFSPFLIPQPRPAAWFDPKILVPTRAEERLALPLALHPGAAARFDTLVPAVALHWQQWRVASSLLRHLLENAGNSAVSNCGHADSPLTAAGIHTCVKHLVPPSPQPRHTPCSASFHQETERAARSVPSLYLPAMP